MRVRFNTRREPPEQLPVSTDEKLREAAGFSEEADEQAAFERVLAIARSPLPDEDD